MSDMNWFIPLCTAVNALLMITVIVLTMVTLHFRRRVSRKYSLKRIDAHGR